MNLFKAPPEIVRFESYDLFATAQVLPVGDGFAAEWCVTRKLQTNIELLGFLSIPVFGQDEREAVRRVHFIGSDVMKFMESVAGGVGAPHTTAPAHAKEHLAHHFAKLPTFSKTWRTAILYDLALQFKVTSPGVALARVEGVNPRAIHDRVASARETGLLPPTTQGKPRV